MTIRRRQTIGSPKTIDAINSSGACDARNVPSRWCIGRSSCLDRSSALEKRRLKLRGHKRRRIQKGERGPSSVERDVAKGTSDACNARRGWNYSRVRFDLRRVVQSIALQLRPGTGGISLARFPYTGCSVKVRIEYIELRFRQLELVRESEVSYPLRFSRDFNFIRIF